MLRIPSTRANRTIIPALHIDEFNITLTLSLALLAISSFNYGFDVQAMAAAQAMTQFTKKFGVYNPKTRKWKIQPYFLSLLNGCHAPAQIAGILIGSMISNKYGRRACIFAMSLFALGTSAIIVSSQTKSQILAGRTIHYTYLGMELAVIPTALAELSPPKYRGSMVSLYWLSIKVGGLVIAIIAKQTVKIQSDLSWRILFSLFFIIPSLVASCIWFVPEPPRWLLSKGRRAEAFASLRRIRRKSLPESALTAEIEAMEQAISEQPQNVRFLDIFKREHRGRTLVVVMANFFQQATGQSFSSQYGTLFVKGLNTVDAFSINMGNNAVNVVGILISSFLADRFGRRPALHTSGIIQVGALMTMGALGNVTNPSVSVREGIVAMLLVFSLGWSIGWAPLPYLIATETPSPSLREYTCRLGYGVKLFMEFLVSFTYPYLEDEEYAGLGGRLGFIYGSMSVLAVIAGYFLLPETKNMALEEIDRELAKSQSSASWAENADEASSRSSQGPGVMPSNEKQQASTETDDKPDLRS